MYRITPRGQVKFERLLRDLWWQPRPPIDPFPRRIQVYRDGPRQGGIFLGNANMGTPIAR